MRLLFRLNCIHVHVYDKNTKASCYTYSLNTSTWYLFIIRKNKVIFSYQVPNCEIFVGLGSCHFYTIKPLYIGRRLRNWNKKFKDVVVLILIFRMNNQKTKISHLAPLAKLGNGAAFVQGLLKILPPWLKNLRAKQCVWGSSSSTGSKTRATWNIFPTVWTISN